MVDRLRRSEGVLVVNAKRVLRIMRAHGLTLAPQTAVLPDRTQEGVVIVLSSNVRWCSDHLELHHWGSAVVRVLFAIDACYRDLVPAYVERRFGATPTPHPVEWLSDNGSAYIAEPTREMAAALGLRLAFTPVRSPQSNGISKAFVNRRTAKRRRCAAIMPSSRCCRMPRPRWPCCRRGSRTTTRAALTRLWSR